MNDYKEYLETGILGSYRPENAVVKNSTAARRSLSSVIRSAHTKEMPASGSVKCW